MQGREPGAPHQQAACGAVAPPPPPPQQHTAGPTSRSSSRCHQHQHQQAGGAAQQQPQQQCQQQQQQQAPLPPLPPLRPPPARACVASNSNPPPPGGAGPRQQQQQRHVHHHHHHQRWPPKGGGAHAGEAICTCVLPRTSVLCRLLVGLTLLLVVVQALSCGLFFCVTLPALGGRRGAPYAADDPDLAVPALEAAALQPRPGGGGGPGGGGAQLPAAPGGGQQQQQQSPLPLSATPKLIPRLIHQAARSRRHLSASARACMRSWRDVNGDAWQVRFYSDDAALAFVRREFPEYFEAYLRLPGDGERGHYFRYMVLLRLGGVFADVGAECRAPLDGLIAPADTLLVGWDAEARDAAAAAAAGLPRTRLLAHWFFAAAPGHPALRALCDAVARRAAGSFSANAARDAAERSGAALWTDVLLRHALEHSPAKRDDPWQVRILPRVAFGVRPAAGAEEPLSSAGGAPLRPDTPGVVVLHHAAAGGQAGRRRSALRALAPLLGLRGAARAGAGGAPAEPVPAANVSHFPVSVAFSPPFAMLTDLVGAGDAQAGDDVSAAITAHGSWQPGLAPHRRPSVVDALAGALAKHRGGPAAAAAAAAADAAGSPDAAAPAGEAAAAPPPGSVPQRGVLVDVGAGQGFFSLAAAARGHRVLAFEASPPSVAAFEASARYNGFQPLISLRRAALGASPQRLCLQAAPGCSGSTAAAPHPRTVAANSSSSGSGDGDGGRQPEQRLLPPPSQGTQQAAQLRRRRGYAWLADGAPPPPDGPCCAAAGERLTLSDVLGNATDVAALRVSAHGHEGWVLEGAARWLRVVHRPAVISVDWWAPAMRAAGYADPAALLRRLVGLGYADVAHAGPLCDARWANATRALRLAGAFAPGARPALQQPTWCKLRPEAFALLAGSERPESVLFLLSEQPPPPLSSDGRGGGSGGGSSSDRGGSRERRQSGSEGGSSESGSSSSEAVPASAAGSALATPQPAGRGSAAARIQPL